MEETLGIISVIEQTQTEDMKNNFNLLKLFDIKQRENCPELSTDRLLRHSDKILLDNFYWK